MPAPSLGTLPWQPALERLDLLAPPTADAVRGADPAWAADCYVAPVADELADTAASARRTRCPSRRPRTASS